MQLTEEIIECLNVECPYSGFRFAFLPQSNSGEIILKNTGKSFFWMELRLYYNKKRISL